MIIKELAFSSFSKIFREHDEMLEGIGFTKNGTVTVLLTPSVTWHVTRDAETCEVLVRSEASAEHKAHKFIISADDFDEITIC